MDKYKKTTVSDYRNYLRTGELVETPILVADLDVELNGNKNTCLNGDGSFATISGGSDNNIVNITYSQLLNLTSTSGLTANQQYKLTDYATVHYMFDKDTRLNDINTGINEPLILTASSTHDFYPECKSELYPQDIIYYDWKTDYWIQDIAFATAENISGSFANPDLTNVELIPNYKGVIYRRHDTKNNNILGYDFRNVKFRRWKFNYESYNSGSTYNINAKVQDDTGVYVSLISNSGNTLSNNEYWNQIVDYTITKYWCNNSSDSSDSLDFIDVYTFHEFDEWNTYEINVKNNIIGNVNDTYSQFWGNIGSSLSNSVFYLYKNNANYQSFRLFDNKINSFFELNTISGGDFQMNVIESEFFNNTIGDNFQMNIIGYNFNTNIIGNNFNNNTIKNRFNNNNIGNFFQMNTIGNDFNTNIIGGNYENNTIQDFFQASTIGNYFFNNTVGNFFNTNTIGKYFTINTIGTYFNYNIIGNYFNKNTIFNSVSRLNLPKGNELTGTTFQHNLVKDDIDFTGINFSSSTHVYADYNTEIFKASDNSIYLKYFNGTSEQYVSPSS